MIALAVASSSMIGSSRLISGKYASRWCTRVSAGGRDAHTSTLSGLNDSGRGGRFSCECDGEMSTLSSLSSYSGLNGDLSEAFSLPVAGVSTGAGEIIVLPPNETLLFSGRVDVEYSVMSVGNTKEPLQSVVSVW